jgi:hypothetical protein
MTPCARIDLFNQYVGLDLTRMYPAGAPPDQELAERWTWDAFLLAAEKCAKGGHPFGMPLSTWSDAVNWVGAVFAAYGAQLVDADGKITVKSDVRRLGSRRPGTRARPRGARPGQFRRGLLASTAPDSQAAVRGHGGEQPGRVENRVPDLCGRCAIERKVQSLRSEPETP